GEISSELPTSEALAQLIPSPNSWAPESHEFANPTPIIAPIRVCELDAGSPKYQVPRFQMMAEINSAKTMANPAPEPTCRISSTGSSDTMPKATAPDDHKTPRKLKVPDHITAIFGASEFV